MPRIENLGLAGLDPESLAGLLSQYETGLTVQVSFFLYQARNEIASQALIHCLCSRSFSLAKILLARGFFTGEQQLQRLQGRQDLASQSAC